MTDAKATFEPMKPSDVHPDVVELLQPGEQVYWQEQPARVSLTPKILVVLALVGGILWQEGLLEDPAAVLDGASPAALVLAILLPLGLIIGLIGVYYYRRDASVYALTSHRVMRVFRGRIVQQAVPEKLQLRGTPKRGSVDWYDVDFPPDSESRGRHGFARVKDGIAVHRLLEAWQQTKIGEADEAALASSQPFRRRSPAAARTPADTEAGIEAGAESIDSPSSASFQRIEHPELGFTMDVPADWEVLVGQELEGPLKLLGITLVKRALRPARLNPYRPDDGTPWNRLVIRGGPSVGMTVKVGPDRMYDENEVLEDPISRFFDIPVKFIERDIEIAGLQGFAVVRELPAGTAPTGLGTLPLPVVARQWWLSSDDLNLEIQGVAPEDSPVLQETVDLIVGSLRRGSR